MRFAELKKISLFAVTVLFFAQNVFAAETLRGEIKTGSQKLEEYRYPVFLYVPESYDASKKYPFLIALPDVDADPALYLAEWLQAGKAKGYIILAPTLKILISEVSVQADQWLLEVKNDIAKRYNTDSARILLAGKKQGAHYAAYLGLRYPEEFSAGIFFGRAWAGPLQSVLEIKGNPSRQRPFFAALDESDADYFQAVEKIAGKMTDKGYPVYLQKTAKENLDSNDVKKQALAWFEDGRESWARRSAESSKGWKAKFSGVIHEFFAVK